KVVAKILKNSTKKGSKNKTTNGSDRDNIAIRLVRFMQLAFLGESFSVKDLESEFGVGDRTIQRDLKALRAHGFEFETKNGITHATALGGGAF
ncbi:MAG: HTH domain-containing protein, partial [Campylobacter sp.]|nr:HTH domain-containing protein [Campylobacter sp.]